MLQWFNQLETTKKAFIQVHLSVLLFGFTGILGKAIGDDFIAFHKVWWRVLLAFPLFLMVPGVWKEAKSMPAKKWFRLLGIGVLVATHWVLFYHSIDISNVSVAVVILSSSTFLTALIEPMVLKRKFRWEEILIGIAIIPGILLVNKGAKGFSFFPIFVALLSALFAVLFSVLNKKIINDQKPSTMSMIELFGAWLALSLFIGTQKISVDIPRFMPTQEELIYLLLLAWPCTVLAFVLNVGGLKHLSTFSVNLAINLEPVYSILLAIPIFAENKELGLSFYLGSLIIILAVFVHPFIVKQLEKNSAIKTE